MTRSRWKALLLALTFAVALPGAAVTRKKSEIVVAAAANLEPALEEIIRGFEAANPDVRVVVTYGASGSAFAQINAGAPFDVFLSADRVYADKLVRAGLAAGAPFTYAYGRLVLWVPRQSPVNVAAGLRVLSSPHVRKIAIAQPRLAPYGAAAEETLKRAGVYESVRSRLVFGESVSQTAQFAASGAADAAFIPLSLALAGNMKASGRWWIVPESMHNPIVQAGVVLGNSRNGRDAARLRDYIVGAKGRAVLARDGYYFPETPR